MRMEALLPVHYTFRGIESKKFITGAREGENF